MNRQRKLPNERSKDDTVDENLEKVCQLFEIPRGFNFPYSEEKLSSILDELVEIGFEFSVLFCAPDQFALFKQDYPWKSFIEIIAFGKL